MVFLRKRVDFVIFILHCTLLLALFGLFKVLFLGDDFRLQVDGISAVC